MPTGRWPSGVAWRAARAWARVPLRRTHGHRPRASASTAWRPEGRASGMAEAWWPHQRFTRHGPRRSPWASHWTARVRVASSEVRGISAIAWRKAAVCAPRPRRPMAGPVRRRSTGEAGRRAAGIAGRRAEERPASGRQPHGRRPVGHRSSVRQRPSRRMAARPHRHRPALPQGRPRRHSEAGAPRGRPRSRAPMWVARAAVPTKPSERGATTTRSRMMLLRLLLLLLMVLLLLLRRHHLLLRVWSTMGTWRWCRLQMEVRRYPLRMRQRRAIPCAAGERRRSPAVRADTKACTRRSTPGVRGLVPDGPPTVRARARGRRRAGGRPRAGGRRGRCGQVAAGGA
mmetsp:Transcript_31198/g.79061  ORF Transcript_31198/g.79061 Transcript_31198/m.79061 type:complete len:343 (+) Transcript_31198:113-1141(+)